jgi:hypothetical protein
MSAWADQKAPIEGEGPTFAETAVEVDQAIPRGEPRPGTVRRSLETATLEQLRALASDLEIKGRSKLDRDGLIAAIRGAR